MDNKIIQVALDGLENILRVGEADRGDPPQLGIINKYALFIEEASGMEKIHECQQNANQEIYKKAYTIIDTYTLSFRLTVVTLAMMMMKMLKIESRTMRIWPINNTHKLC